MKLSLLCNAEIGTLSGEDVEFASVSTDTRTLKPGQLFVALRGENFDAHDMTQEAEARGACGLVVERRAASRLPQIIVDDTTKALGKIAALYRGNFRGKVIAVTGSSGKTTVKGMLKSICEVSNTCIATKGNLNNHIGVPLTLMQLGPQADYAIVEAGTGGKGEIAYLTALIQPDIALVVNVQPAHLGGFGSLEAIAREKSEIYRGGNNSIAVLNLDDDNKDILRRAINHNRVVGFTTRKYAELRPQCREQMEIISLESVTKDGVGRPRFELQVGGKTEHVNLSIIGPHNIQNAAAAAAAAHAAGISPSGIKRGLENYRGIEGRMQLLAGINGSTIIDDSYNANPGSMMAAIDFLADYQDSYLLCGDMAELGPDAKQLHRQVGSYAREKSIGHVLSVGANAKYISVEYGPNGRHFANRTALIREFKPLLNDKMVVLVKGSRSAQMETIVQALSAGGIN